VTDREAFCAMLDGSQLETADAAVLLCGEDVGPRAAVAINLLASHAVPHIIASGGKHDPPRWMGATEVQREMYAKGVQPGRITVEGDSQNTREQAMNVVAIAKAMGYTKLILVASNYHAPRAFLTFLHALVEADLSDTVRLMSAPARASWLSAPDGMHTTRWTLRENEMQKIEDYRAHVSDYYTGQAYLRDWDGKR
jgi:uncharacterized SAM-binding protein YcdF (DUF218 family)